MRRIMLFVLVTMLMLLAVTTAPADHTPATETELVEAFELTFAIPKGYTNDYGFRYSGGAGEDDRTGTGRYTYQIDTSVTLHLTLNSLSIASFESKTGLHPRIGQYEYMGQVAEWIVSNDTFVINSSNPILVELDSCSTKEFELRRYEGFVLSTGASFHLFVALSSQRLYYGMEAVSVPGYMDACSAYIDSVLSEVLPGAMRCG